MTKLQGLVLLALGAGLLAACAPRRVTTVPERPPAGASTTTSLPAEAWVDAHVKSLSLEQKVAQMFSAPVYGRFTSADDPAYQRIMDLVDRFQIGGVMFFQGDPFSQAVLTNDLQRRARIPLLVSQDMEWGAGMRVENTTTFPPAMAIGATGDPELARAAGRVTAEEAKALGVHQIYAPVADVNNNPGNPIINVRSFGERPDLVGRMVVAFVDGAQQNGTIATLKHFPGHGDTATDSHADLPIIPHDEARLDSLELLPFREAIQAGARSIMTGHLAFPRLEPDVRVPATLSRNVTEGLLRQKLGFDGLVVTDALNMQGVTKNFSTGEIAVRAVEAGADVLLLSEDEYAARDSILEAVRAGRISESRIDASVRRILRAKAAAGLHQNALVDLDEMRKHIDAPANAAVAEAIARRSLTLLRNQNNVLPIGMDVRRIFVAAVSDGNDQMVAQPFLEQLHATAPGIALSVRLIDPQTNPATIEDVVRQAAGADLILVPAFVRVRAWSGRIGLDPRQQQFVNELVRTGKPVVLVSFGNPYIITGLDLPAAYVATYSSMDVSQRAAAQALLGHGSFPGRLPVSIPGYYAVGSGMGTMQASFQRGLPEEAGLKSVMIEEIDTLISRAILQRAFPGAVVAVGRGGVLAHLKAYGYQTYDRHVPISVDTPFDLASLTKVIATTTAVMKLYEAGKIDLDAPVARYLPEFGRNGKEKVTIRHLLTHTAGLIAFRPFHTLGITTRQGIIDAIMSEKLEYEPGTKSVYSDFGPITLMLVMERITGEEFGQWVQREVFIPMGMNHTGYRKAGEPDPSIAPTEVDKIFRHRLVQGEVHDETAWILGGTSGHAGLFSTGEDLSRFAAMLIAGGQIDGRQFLKPETIRLFTTAADPTRHTRALGWDTRSARGYSSAGRKFGPRSFGHTGFTGTSIWIDPDQGLFVILLSNRVYPTRENSRITDVRPALADVVYDAIERPYEPLGPKP